MISTGIAHPDSFDDLAKIFQISKKGLLRKHCRDLVIHGNDFAKLTSQADHGKSHYFHRIYSREIVPKDLNPTLNELPTKRFDELSPTHKSKLLKRLSQVVKVRRQLVGHMFFDKEISFWHFFYFDQRDTSERGNHWNSGPHIHLINYLWAGRDPVYILKEFLQPNPRITGSLHIRFVER